jgi:aminomethyltransferase
MDRSPTKRTHLYQTHIALGGKMVTFASWELPLFYESLVQEHEATRNAAGLFDVSHMGEISIKGEDASSFVNYMVTNDVSLLWNDQIAYSLICYPDGGIVDDVLIYKFSSEHFMLVVNASNLKKDLDWMFSHVKNFKVKIDNLSDELSQIALQGPRSQHILQQLTSFDLSSLKFFFFFDSVMLQDIKCLVSRSGYTGEDGFEIYVKNQDVNRLFLKILELGKPWGLNPAGIGCRDTLRFEASLPLYGNEISQSISPLEASLHRFVKFSKEDFIGKDSLLKQKTLGLSRTLVRFEMLDRAIPRHGYEVFCEDEREQIGFVTTGYFSPTLKKNVGLALLAFPYLESRRCVKILIRNKFYSACIIQKSFYHKNDKQS